jgi:hypothetical protein
MALVELVQNDRVDAFQGWIRQQTAGQNTFCDKPQSRAPTYRFFEADLVANRSTNLFAQFPSDPSCRHTRRDPTRLEHYDFATEETKNGRWNPGGLPGSRWRFDDKAGRMLQGRKNLRQNRIHRKCWLSIH